MPSKRGANARTHFFFEEQKVAFEADNLIGSARRPLIMREEHPDPYRPVGLEWYRKQCGLLAFHPHRSRFSAIVMRSCKDFIFSEGPAAGYSDLGR